MNPYPVVSVLLATYNTDFLLVKRAIESVLRQDYQLFELIVIDDGSEEQFEVPLKKFTASFPDKITYLRHGNRGQSMSINKGISYSRGAYITIIDADDEFKPNHLSSCLRNMNNVDLIASTTETIVSDYADFYVPDKWDMQQVIHVDDCILFATLFGKREVFTTYSFCDMYGADSHFYEQASINFITRKVNLRTYIYYRNNPNSICTRLKQKKNIAAGIFTHAVQS